MKPKPVRDRLRRAMAKADVIWSARIRRRDGKCMFCGKTAADTKSLSAHHWIRSKSSSNRSRWEDANGITLCQGCHIRVLHRRADYATVSRCAKALNVPPATADALAAVYASGWGQLTETQLLSMLEVYIASNRSALEWLKAQAAGRKAVRDAAAAASS